MKPRPKYMSWLLQAESDLRSTAHLASGGHFAQACFQAQQTAEKALKSLAFFRGADLIKSHSLDTIAKELKLNGELATFAVKLDLYYLTARYPDALPENAVPAEKFTREIAEEALFMAETFLNRVKEKIQS